MLLLSGRTPYGEGGRTGARDLPIHWGQEMRDQGGMLRELVKWDYELRLPEQVPELIDRALAIAMSPPMGPVYLSLPREVLCSAVDGITLPATPRQQAMSASIPSSAAIEQAARLIATAERPLLITQRAGAFAAGFEALAQFAARFALPVVEFWPSRISLPVDHPMHAGFDPAARLAEADLVLAIDSLVPWIPLRHPLPAGCRGRPARARPAVHGHAGAWLPVRSGVGGGCGTKPGHSRAGFGAAGRRAGASRATRTAHR